jgi:hypothetical protein
MTTDVSLVEELNLVKNSADPRAPYFTGWKSADPNSWLLDHPADESLGYCGQIIRWLGDPITHAAYVNLPGGESGVILAGNSFSIGDERLYVAPSLEEMRKMLLDGLKRLNEVVDKYNADQTT